MNILEQQLAIVNKPGLKKELQHNMLIKGIPLCLH